MVSLRKQAQRCNFGESLEDSLCDQLIKKLPDMEWKQKLLEVQNISLADSMDKVQLQETAHEQATWTVAPSQEDSLSTDAVGTKCGRA